VYLSDRFILPESRATSTVCASIVSVPNRPGRLSVVRPGRPKCRAAVFGQDGGPYRVRHFSSGQGVDSRGLVEMAGDY